MKATILTALLATLAALSVAQSASAQSFDFGPVHIDFNGGHDDFDSNDFSSDDFEQGTGYRPYIKHPSRPTPDQFLPVPDQYRPNPWQKTIYTEPKKLEKLVFNPRTGRWEVKISHDEIKESALDPNRNVVDRYSLTRETKIGYDRQGRKIETTVTSWTSYGVPHSNTTTRIISNHGPFQVEEETNVVRAPNPFADP